MTLPILVLRLVVGILAFPMYLLNLLGVWNWICKRCFPYFLLRFTVIYNEQMASKKKELFSNLQEFAGPSGKLSLLEVGCGTGANFKFYPPGCRVTCVDPNPNFEKFLFKSVSENRQLQFERFVVAAGENMHQVADGSMDAVVCTLVLCSVENQGKILREVCRVLRPGGAFYFMEHVADKPSTWNYFWQQVLDPAWYLLFDGCNLTRESWKTLEQAGFSKLKLQHIQAPLSWTLVRPHIYGLDLSGSLTMALKGRALYDFHSENKEEISIQQDEDLVIFSETSLDGWLQGQNSRGETGLFPASYVEIVRPGVGTNHVDYPSNLASSLGTQVSLYNSPSMANPARSGGGSGFLSNQGSFEDDDDDDWDDWDDGCTVVEEPRAGGLGTNGHPPLNLSYPGAYPSQHMAFRPKAPLERQDSMASAKRGSVVGRNLNRFSCFVRSGVEAFILGDVPMMAKIAETYSIEMGPRGPQWKANPHPFACSVEDPTKQTKFKGIKSYISYKLTPTHAGSPVYRRYKHFDWLYNRLLHKFTVISVPHLPEKQATGRFEEDFIEKRKRRLILWMDHMTSHPVLSQYEGFQHFLSCLDDKQWKMGKRRAEKDEMVGASFLLTFQIPTEHQDLQDVEDRVDTFKAFSKKMDDSVLQLSTVASELVRKHVGGFRKEFQKLGSAFQAISHAFQMDPPFSSEALNNAISHTGRTYETVGEMFAEQPKNDLFQMLDTLSLYQGLLSNFPDIIHLQKGAFAKVKESQRMSDEGRMAQEEADGIRRRCRVVGFALQAEMNHFHQRRELDFKHMMQSYLRQQILFYQRVGQQLEKALRMYDHL